MTSNPTHAATIIGISGCSSSGKTTLSRILRSIFPNTFILHQDDFYLSDAEIPITDGLQDWDCAGSLDLPGLRSALQHIHAYGTLPPSLVSKEDQNTAGPSGVSGETIASLRDHVASVLGASPTKPICILDGFLLYPPSVAPYMLAELDIKLFLLTTYAAAKARRERRQGYVTLEGFWEDPPGYVDKIVWPNYVSEHAGFFKDGDVDGKVKQDVIEEIGIRVQPGREAKMEEVLKWAVEEILVALGKVQ